MKYLIVFFSIALFYSCSDSSSKTEEKQALKKDYITTSPYDLVNPFIGTGGHGHTFPGATMPFGMVQLSPDTRLDGWDGCSGYHYSDSIIFGFSHTHLSGTGVSDYGDLLVTPFNAESIPAYQDLMHHTLTKSAFSKESEEAHPGYYKVNLSTFDIDVELTATTWTGIHKYTFNNPKNRKIALNLNHRDKVLDCKFEIIDETTIIGYRISEAWATEQHIYFAMKFSEPFKAEFPTGQATIQDLFRVLSFEDSDKPIIVKVGLSAVDTKSAEKTLYHHSTFEELRAEARAVWEKQLGKIEVKGTNEEHLINFYTALYHTMIAPNVFSNEDGHYRGMDQKIHWTNDHKVYTVFSLWDTFRGLHPLFSLIEREKNLEFIKTFLRQYQDGGMLPVWELAGNETGCMIGYHAVPVILDYYNKLGQREFDDKLALEAMIHSAEMDHLGLKAYKEKGYIAAGDEAESVSKTLEYAYDDWCIAQMASIMNEKEIYKKYIARAQNYLNLFNPETGFMQAKMNGGFAPNFDPAEVNFNYTEANAWQYSMFVPQDIQGLIALHGGEANFEKKLDALFTTEMKLSGRHQVDITGLIGQYAHGNEPSHHMAYLYNYIGKPWKTQEKIHQILTEQYWNGSDGLSGNEDCGQMSAWYVLSAMGIYSVTPGADHYAIGSPLFDEVKIHLENGKTFTIKANGRSADANNFYIQSAKLDGEDYNKSYLNAFDILMEGEGGLLEFEMGSSPNKSWASSTKSRPFSSIPEEDRIIPVPYSSASSQTFEESQAIELKSVCKECKIMYSQNEGPFEEYKNTLTITESTDFVFYAIKNGKESKKVKSAYKKIKGGKTVIYKSEYSNQYSGGGDKALIDYLKGSPNFRTGYWQGFQGQDVEVIIDLQKIEEVNKISVGCLQDIKSWIWLPKEVTFWTSNNNKDWKELAKLGNNFPKDTYGGHTKDFTKNLNFPIQTRYIKVKLTYPGDCPDWHLGAGGKAWVFVDEVMVE